MKWEFELHKTWFKCFFNPILRRIQFWTDRPYVIYSNVSFDEVGGIKVLGYGFGRVKYSIKVKE